MPFGLIPETTQPFDIKETTLETEHVTTAAPEVDVTTTMKTTTAFKNRTTIFEEITEATTAKETVPPPPSDDLKVKIDDEIDPLFETRTSEPEELVLTTTETSIEPTTEKTIVPTPEMVAKPDVEHDPTDEDDELKPKEPLEGCWWFDNKEYEHGQKVPPIESCQKDCICSHGVVTCDESQCIAVTDPIAVTETSTKKITPAPEEPTDADVTTPTAVDEDDIKVTTLKETVTEPETVTTPAVVTEESIETTTIKEKVQPDVVVDVTEDPTVEEETEAVTEPDVVTEKYIETTTIKEKVQPEVAVDTTVVPVVEETEEPDIETETVTMPDVVTEEDIETTTISITPDVDVATVDVVDTDAVTTISTPVETTKTPPKATTETIQLLEGCWWFDNKEYEHGEKVPAIEPCQKNCICSHGVVTCDESLCEEIITTTPAKETEDEIAVDTSPTTIAPIDKDTVEVTTLKEDDEMTTVAETEIEIDFTTTPKAVTEEDVKVTTVAETEVEVDLTTTPKAVTEDVEMTTLEETEMEVDLTTTPKAVTEEDIELTTVEETEMEVDLTTTSKAITEEETEAPVVTTVVDAQTTTLSPIKVTTEKEQPIEGCWWFDNKEYEHGQKVPAIESCQKDCICSHGIVTCDESQCKPDAPVETVPEIKITPDVESDPTDEDIAPPIDEIEATTAKEVRDFTTPSTIKDVKTTTLKETIVETDATTKPFVVTEEHIPTTTVKEIKPEIDTTSPSVMIDLDVRTAPTVPEKEDIEVTTLKETVLEPVETISPEEDIETTTLKEKEIEPDLPTTTPAEIDLDVRTAPAVSEEVDVEVTTLKETILEPAEIITPSLMLEEDTETTTVKEKEVKPEVRITTVSDIETTTVKKLVTKDDISTAPSITEIDVDKTTVDDIDIVDTTTESLVVTETDVPTKITTEAIQPFLSCQWLDNKVYKHGEIVSPIHSCQTNCLCSHGEVTCDETLCETTIATTATVEDIIKTTMPKEPTTVPTTTLESRTTISPVEPKIPGEGNCLVDMTTYRNGDDVPTSSTCQEKCTCKNSVVTCQLSACPSTPPAFLNCEVKTVPSECCPTYECREY